ncbi:inner membrane protein CreD [Pseudooceanicola batsensis HTCC2597]|uniref:Inner membrane protein CreD n=1 Tax=Pseudooceanicola batsensis (strain ATCC BAA-863 / DSM 15984 / KCTC 12145 / HTCC2597) TaxID=252305 RepID=A3TV23_PSEBH|nr:cell envelope integrity protein CreD [Pseudooceanicola batsensis]EAQ04369.1 inner membrane protein CreD [Pseudooceanicola batsensis HTCC2597]
MRRGFGTRFLIVGILILLMFIPLFFVSAVIEDRHSLSRDTVAEIGRLWGGEQTLAGPVLEIPVTEEVERDFTRDLVDPETGEVLTDPETGEPRTETFRQRVTERRAPLHVYPDRFDVEIATQTEVRHRGIFTAPVYRAQVDIAFDFPMAQVAALDMGSQTAAWDRARIRFFLSGNNALRRDASLTGPGGEIALEPNGDARQPGIVAAPGDPRGGGTYNLSLGINGAGLLRVTPVGRQTEVTMRSDWPHPSFRGAFLPDESEITDAGFAAHWSIPHLARSLQQISRSHPGPRDLAAMSFGVSFYEPNDFYQKAYRAARYGILYIALTFLTVLLIDRTRDRPVHPVQYFLIGLAQSTFVLLMVSYAEQIGFAAAYALSAGAVTLLLTLFGWLGLSLGRRALVLGAMLVLVYAVLYLILQSEDYALLAGSTLAFVAIAATMFVTRNEDWYGPEGRGLFRTKTSGAPASPEG